MGIMKRLFNNKETKQPVQTSQVVESNTQNNKIEAILVILGELGLLRENVIRDRLQGNEFYQEEILKSLGIMPPQSLEYLESYLGYSRFGYGPLKMKEVREELKEIEAKKTLSHIEEKEIEKEMISCAKRHCDLYKNILLEWNEKLKQIEQEEKDFAKKKEKMSALESYYKEQKLGYPISLDRKIKEMREDLAQLPYKGYGEVELIKFEEAAKKLVEEGRNIEEDREQTLSRIQTELWTPRRNRYLKDVENLERKLQMIEDSPYISAFDKEQNKRKTIKEFNVMNGHKEDTSNFVEELKKKLTELQYGGYGEEYLNQFETKAGIIISDGNRVGKKEEEIKRDVQIEYQKLVDSYQKKVLDMKEAFYKIEHDWLTREEKEQRKEQVMEEFHDEMGLPINQEERLENILSELRTLDHGGYGDLKVEEFRKKAEDRLKGVGNRMELRDALKDIRQLQQSMIKDYQEELKKLYRTVQDISHDRHLKTNQKQEAIDNYEREFKFKVGFRMNFGKYIENRIEELRNLEKGGYGEEALEEFRTEATEIANSSLEEKEKYNKIRAIYENLRSNYLKNKKTFAEWKKEQLEGISKEEKQRKEEEIDQKIDYMLTLSPKGLQAYYLEDDRKKKELAEQHNYRVAFKYLARQEAKYKRSEMLYQERLAELDSGLKPYTREELEDAMNELKILAITSDELEENERIITLVDYIDSTLLRQMMYAEANLLKASE